MVIIILLLVAVLMVLTVPDKQQHKEAMMEAINEYVEEEAVDKLGDNVLAKLGKGVIVKTVETALNSKLKVDNYYLFNTTHVRMKGEDQILSAGLFGHVFTFDKEMLREKLEEAMTTTFLLSMLAGVFITVVGCLAAKPMLRMLGTPADILDDAALYIRIIFAGTCGNVIYNNMNGMVQGLGDAKWPMYALIVSSITNILLDLLFIGVFHMGAFGAALATIIGQAVSLASSVTYLYRHRESFYFDFKLQSFRIHRESLKALFRMGIPLALQSCAVSISQLFISANVNAYGLVISAVNGVGNKISQVASVVTNAVSSAASAMIGQNLAAGRRDRITKVMYISMGIGLVYTGLLSLLMILFPEQIFGLFNKEPEILAMAHTYVIIAVLNFIGFALRNPMMALMSGLGCAKLALFTGIMDGIVSRIFLAILMGEVLGMGIMGYWLGNVFAGYMPFVIGGVFFFTGLWKRVQPVVKNSEGQENPA